MAPNVRRSGWFAQADGLAPVCCAPFLPEYPGCPRSASPIALRYQALLAQFQAPDFLISGDFLIDMGGHELMAALAAHLRGLGAPPGFTDSFLEEELLRVLTPLYQPGAIYQPDDFQDLAVILGQY